MASFAARYAGTCSKCGRSFSAGDPITGSRDAGWGHSRCPKGPAKTLPKRTAERKPPRQPAFPAPENPPEPGAHRIQGERKGRGDSRYMVGMTVHATKVSEPGGGPDGHFYTVLAARLFSPCEDNGEYSWHEVAWVRAATDAEAAEKANAMRRADAPKAVLDYIVGELRGPDGCGAGDTDARDLITAAREFPGAVSLALGDKHLHFQVVVLAGAYVVGYHGGFYDDYRARSALRATTPLLEQAVRALISGKPDDLAVASDAIAETIARATR